MSEKICWVDLETSGLNVEDERILEVACYITDMDLSNQVLVVDNVVKYVPEMVQSIEAFTIPYVRRMHEETGLWDRLKTDENRLSIEEIEEVILDEFVSGTTYYLGGSSPQFDRAFINEYMPRLGKKLHYRNFDSSTLKAAMTIAIPDVFIPWFDERSSNTTQHSAVSDINVSMDIYDKFLKEMK